MRYEAPGSIDEAVSLLAGATGKAKVMAGGTDLLVQLRAGMVEPDLVVDIKKIPEVLKISNGKGGYRVGAAVSGAELGEHSSLPKDWPGVVEAVGLIGSTQVQGRASMGGNLCNASPAADSVPAMIAAGLTCVIAGPKGKRELPVEKVAAGPGKTNLDKGEFIVEFAFPERAKHTGDAYLRFIPRTEMDIAVVGAGVCLTLDDSGTCTAARVGLGAVAPTALLVEDAGKALVGTKVDEAALDKMVEAVRKACKPISDKRGTVDFRIKVAGVMAKRAALIALERAKGN